MFLFYQCSSSHCCNWAAWVVIFQREELNPVPFRGDPVPHRGHWAVLVVNLWEMLWAVHTNCGEREGRRKQYLVCDTPHNRPEPPANLDSTCKETRGIVGLERLKPLIVQTASEHVSQDLLFLVELECLLHRSVGEWDKNFLHYTAPERIMLPQNRI